MSPGDGVGGGTVTPGCPPCRRERRRRHHMSVWEQRTSQLRRHMQMSSQEGINKDEPPLINPHASIFRRKRPGEGLEKCAEEHGKAEGPEQPVPGANPGGGEDRTKRDAWQQKSCHGNCEAGEQDGAGGSAEDRARMRQSQRRSRHRRARLEGKDTAGTLGSRSASQETGLEEASTAEGAQDGDGRGDAAAAEALIPGDPEASGDSIRSVPAEGILPSPQLLIFSSSPIPLPSHTPFCPLSLLQDKRGPCGRRRPDGERQEGDPPTRPP